MTDGEAVFEVDGGVLVPGELARGPWYPDFVHGATVAAALLRAIDREAAARGLEGRLVRFALELGRPVPVTPWVPRAEVRHAGRRTQTLEAVLDVDGTRMSRATALLMVPP